MRDTSQLRVLWTTEPRSPHAFTAHPRVDSAVVEAVQEAMIELAGDAEARIHLQRLKFAGLEAAVDDDWDDIRGLQLEQLDL